MIHIAIVDDNEIFLKHLKENIFKELFKSDIDFKIKDFNSGEHFLASLSEVSYDFVFLDVEMPVMNGIEVSKELYKKDKNTIIIFLTSHDSYMREAFGLNVYQYISKENVDLMVPKVVKKILIEIIFKSTVALKTPGGVRQINLETIMYIGLNGRYPYLMTHKGKPIELISSSLKSVHRTINSLSFLHINNNTIVNMKYIETFSNRSITLMNNEEVFTVSRGRQRELYHSYIYFISQGDSL